MIDQAQSSFWRVWKLKLEEQKRVADHTRVLEQIIPGVEIARFLSGDIDYMEGSVLSLIKSVKLEKKRILKDVLKLASAYGLDHSKVCSFPLFRLNYTHHPWFPCSLYNYTYLPYFEYLIAVSPIYFLGYFFANFIHTFTLDSNIFFKFKFHTNETHI